MEDGFYEDILTETPRYIDTKLPASKSSDHFYTLTIVEDSDEDEAHGSMEGSASTSSSQPALGNLVSENLSLQKKLNRQSDELAEVRAQLRGFSGSCDGFNNGDTPDAEVVRLESLDKNGSGHAGLLEIINVPEFVRSLVYELKPRLVKNFVPCLPSYLILAGFRYDDRTKDEQRLTGLFNTLHSALKQISIDSVDMDLLSFWLINSWRLFNLLRQYSGEAVDEWTAKNTDKQNAHRLQNFNLEPIRSQLKLRIEAFYESFMKKTVQPVLEPKIVPGILQHESITDSLFAQPPTGNSNVVTRQISKDLQVKSLDDLVEFLSIVYNKLKAFGGDPVLIGQVFRQIVQWTCALALNQLMFRKDLCTFEKAIQIKHNVMEIQNWLCEKNLREYRDNLEPLVQACHLLQSRKDEGNLDILCGEMTSKLKPRQVVAILQHYTPSNGFEEDPIDSDFLIKVQAKLNQRAIEAGVEDKDSLIMPGTYLQPFDISEFVHSDFMLETLTLPPFLKLKEFSRLL